MRDLLLVAVIVGSIPYILRRPYIGVLVYVWLSVMNPHRLTWGFTYGFSFAIIIGAVTLVAVLLNINKDVKPPPINSLMVALLLFVAWTGVTFLFSLYPSFDRWQSLMKTMLMVLLIPMLFHRKEELRQLIWVIVLSIAYYGTKGGVWILLTGGGEKVWGPEGSYITDNNALAATIVMTIPLMRYLQLTSPHRYVKWGLTAMMLFCGVSVLGSYSRGAFLAAAMMVAFLWWKGRHKLPVLFIVILAIPFAISFMPERWHNRMDTINTYEEDSSANMRLNAWATMLNLAKDRPIVGGGMEVAEKGIYAQYSPDPSFPPQVAHSIYFQAMGEHGFVGLAFYLLLYITFWRHAGALARLTKDRPDLAWARDFGAMIQVSLVGFAVGGAFLSLVNFDVPYYLIGIMIAVRTLIDREVQGAPAPMVTANRPGRLAGTRPDHSPKPGIH